MARAWLLSNAACRACGQEKGWCTGGSKGCHHVYSSGANMQLHTNTGLWAAGGRQPTGARSPPVAEGSGLQLDQLGWHAGQGRGARTQPASHCYQARGDSAAAAAGDACYQDTPRHAEPSLSLLLRPTVTSQDSTSIQIRTPSTVQLFNASMWLLSCHTTSGPHQTFLLLNPGAPLHLLPGGFMAPLLLYLSSRDQLMVNCVASSTAMCTLCCMTCMTCV